MNSTYNFMNKERTQKLGKHEMLAFQSRPTDGLALQEKLKVSLLSRMCSEITSCSSVEDVSFSRELMTL